MGHLYPRQRGRQVSGSQEGIALIFTNIFCRTFGQFLACRTLMGVFEAAYLPCAVYYCSLFYPRRELGFRTAIFYQMGVIAVRHIPDAFFPLD